MKHGQFDRAFTFFKDWQGHSALEKTAIPWTAAIFVGNILKLNKFLVLFQRLYATFSQLKQSLGKIFWI